MEKAVTRAKENIGKALIVFLIAIFIMPQTLFAAGLNFSPSSGTHNKDSNFSVGIFVSSPDKAINAASAIIKFPSDKLQVVSVSKNNSIVDFWAQEPSFSNAIGEIKLEGVILTPGYQGNSGRLLTINLKGKNPGIAGLTIFSSSVLANDGIGTNVLASVGTASFTIVELPQKEPKL